MAQGSCLKAWALSHEPWTTNLLIIDSWMNRSIIYFRYYVSKEVPGYKIPKCQVSVSEFHNLNVLNVTTYQSVTSCSVSKTKKRIQIFQKCTCVPTNQGLISSDCQNSYFWTWFGISWVVRVFLQQMVRSSAFDWNINHFPTCRK